MKKLASWLSIALLCVVASAVATRAQIVNRVVDQIIATACTNQFVRSVAASGAATCATIAQADLGANTTWTPTDGSGASLVFTGVSASYTRIGNMVFAYAQVTYPATGSANAATITGLPVTVANADYAQQCTVTFSNGTVPAAKGLANKNSAVLTLYAASGTAVTNANLTGSLLVFICIYPAT